MLIINLHSMDNVWVEWAVLEPKALNFVEIDERQVPCL